MLIIAIMPPCAKIEVPNPRGWKALTHGVTRPSGVMALRCEAWGLLEWLRSGLGALRASGLGFRALGLGSRVYGC